MANVILGRGRLLLGRRIFAGHLGAGAAGPVVVSFPNAPGEYSVKVFNADGTKLAEWGSAVQANPILKLDFELLETGCGSFDMTLAELPAVASLDYGMRVDIHLFNDALPWYSGYINSRPVAGTTATTFVYKGYGFFQQLDTVLVNQTYESLDVALIAKAILQAYIEPSTDILYNSTKITAAGYVATKLRFDNIDAKSAMKKLAEFATGYVYGVDEAREFFFRPVTATINEQARLYVGVHISEYTPTEDLSDLCNYALIKGATMDESGSNILATVQDATSQTTYGKRQKVLSVPAAVSAADATRWGEQEIGRRKDPKRKAQIKGLKLEYPNADGTYNVRRIKPDGKAAIGPVDGSAAHEYPITKIKYSITSQGILATLDLGELPKTMESWFVDSYRRKADSDAIGDANNVQLKGGAL